MPRITLYSKPDCPLCDHAERLLRSVAGSDIEKIDISGDAELFARHRDSVPVVAIDGVVRFRGRLKKGELLEALRK